MKKNKILNIVLTSIMLVSTILTPQISYALGDNLNGKTAEASEQAEPEETVDGDEAVVPSPAAEDEGDDEADSAEIESKTSDNEADDNNETTTNDEDVGSEEPEDININDPPVEEENEVEKDAEEDIQNQSIDIYAAVDLGNIFTFVSLKLSGEEIADDSVIEIGDGTIVNLEYAWETEGLDAKAGDTASIALPNTFKEVNIRNQDIITGGIHVGTYSIMDGILEFVFNENIEEGAVHSGHATLGLEFNLDKFQEDVEQEIHFNDNSEKVLTVIAKPTGDVSGITKEGHPDRDQDAREINWSVDVINDNDEPITGAQLKDILPAGLGDPRDFVVTELSVGINGGKTPGNTVEISPAIVGNTFEINFDSISSYSGYRVEYITTINDYTIESFTNNAHFTYGQTDLPADATVHVENRSNPIEKDGVYNQDTGQIDWVINVNESGGEIGEAIVYDELPEELSLVPGSIKVAKYDDNWQWIENLTLDTDDFPLKLGRVESNEIYHIRFSTDIDWSEENSGDYKRYNEFANKTTLYDGENPVGEDDARVGFSRAPLLEKSGAQNVDYENKTLTWTVDVNKANHPLENVVVTDLIPAGLTINEDDIVITREDGEIFTPLSVTTNSTNDGETEVTISLGDIGTEHITITYTTVIEDFTENEFTNIVGIEGVGIGEEEHGKEEPISVPANSFGKNFSGINYNAKTMDWGLTVNPIREAIDELTIVDTFPNKGMIFLPDTLEITVGGEKVTDGFTVTPNTEDEETGYHKGFTIVFDNNLLPLNAEMKINYQTSYDPQLEVGGKTLEAHTNAEDSIRVYKNHAQYTGKTVNGNEFNPEREANRTVREDSWNSGKKEGQLVREDDEGDLINGWESGADRKIAWQLYTNYQKQNLGTDVVISDELDYEGIIDEDSVKVSVYDVSVDGETKITEDILDSDNYEVSYNGKNFELTFADGFVVDERYVIEFTTSVPNISQENYTNRATVKVGDSEYPYAGTVHYDRHNNFLDKGPTGLEGSNVFTGDEIDWEVKVNESLSSILRDVEIVDTISPGLVYVEDSLEIVRLEGTEEVPLVEGEDYNLDVKLNEETKETVLTVAFAGDVEHILLLRYATVVTKTDGAVNNIVEFKGTGIEKETKESETLSAREFSSVGGQFNPNRGAIHVKKVDTAGEIIDSSEATFELWYVLNGERVEFVQEDEFTTVDGVLEIGNLPLRTYYLQEIESPDGYILSHEEIEINVTESLNNHGIYEVDFENIAEVEVSVSKVWEDADDQDGIRPETITVNLLADGDVVDTAELSAEGDWSASFTGLSPINEDGKEIEYTVEEVEVDGYDSERTVEDDENPLAFTFTNTHEPEVIDLEGTKTWDDADNQDGKRPSSILVNLLADGEKVEDADVTVTEGTNWEYTFTGLPKYDNGKEIEYTVQEDAVEEYEVSYDGLDITNSYIPETTEISVEKAWDDADNQDGVRPSNVTVNLLVGSKIVDSVVLNEGNNWQYTFTNLPVNAEGVPIEYSITENTVSGYSTSVDVDPEVENSYVVTNDYTPEETSVTVTKGWEDGNNQDGNRPNEIQVQLLADGELHGDPVILSAGNWTHTWDGLDLNADGEAINYSVEEVNIPEGYTSSFNDEDHGNITITNSYTPETTEVSVNKAWDDADNQDGVRPNEVTVNLLADGEIARTAVLNSEDWAYTFDNLPVYEDGVEINYTVTETTVEGYSFGVTDRVETDEGTFIEVTNTRTPDETSVTVTKSWNDSNNQDGKQPNEIQVQLLADGEPQGEPVTLLAAEQWTYTWSGLAENADGAAIVYSVEEVNIPEGYTSSINDTDHGNIIITNSYEPELTEVPVLKVWDDADNQDGERPAHITLNLLNDRGEIVKRAVVQEQEGNEWEYTFENLPKFENGEEINYSVTEDFVSDYSTEVEENDNGVQVVTNSYTPAETSATVTKGWNDGNNQDGNRPDEIQVQLLADGEALGEVVTLTAENWTHTWDELALKADGSAINYSVEEVNVPEGYTSSINDRDHGNIIVTNNYDPELMEIPVQKTWDDAENQDGIRPERVEVNLLADGEKIREAHITEATDWQHVFTDLPRFKVGQEGQEVVYTLNENNVENYSLTNNEFNEETEIHELTNSYTPEETTVTVTKSWNDESNQDGNRPETIGVRVIANEVETDYVAVLSEENDWTHTWEELALNDAGTPINYSVIETSVSDEYDVSINDDDHGNVIITNSYTPEITDIIGEKIWNDADNQDGKRPDSITVNLLSNGNKVDAVEVTEATDWKYEFTGLPKFEDGEEINYTVQEKDVKDYSTEIDGTEITNSYTPGKISVNVVKSWKDEHNKDARPDSITVNLLADGEVVDSVKLNAENNWQADFVDLSEYKDGVLIDYTVEEVAVEGYESSVTGTSEDGFVITNTQKPEEPGDPDPKEPTDPKDPEKPQEGTPGDPEDPTDPEESDGNGLPITGEAATYVGLAVTLLIVGITLAYYNRKSTN